MKWILFVFGLITAIVGLLPVLNSLNKLPMVLSFLPVEGNSYGFIVLAVGVIEVILAIKK